MNYVSFDCIAIDQDPNQTNNGEDENIKPRKRLRKETARKYYIKKYRKDKNIILVLEILSTKPNSNPNISVYVK